MTNRKKAREWWIVWDIEHHAYVGIYDNGDSALEKKVRLEFNFSGNSYEVVKVREVLPKKRRGKK